MDIIEIIDKRNELLINFNICKLQVIRKDLKNLSRRTGNKIFLTSTISEDGSTF